MRTILIHLDLKLEVIGLRSAGGQLCVNVELSLPLVLAKVGRQCDLVSITFEASLSEVDAVPVVASSEVVAKIEGFCLVNGLPQVVGIVVVQAGYWSRSTTCLLEVDLADLHVGTTRRTTEVEEQTDGCCVSTLFQGDTLALQDERLTTSHVVTLLDEEVRIASISEFEGHLRQILIRLHNHIEIIGLLSTGCQLGVDMELSLPLVLAKVGRQCDSPDIVFVGCLGKIDSMPVIASSEVVTKRIVTCVNGLPEVGSSIVVPVELVLTATIALAAILIGLASAIVEGVILQHHISDFNHGTCLTATKVEYEVELGDVLTFHIALGEQILSVALERNNLVEVEVRIVSSIRQFHSSTVQILTGLQFDREVIVLTSLSGNTTKVLQLELCLPALVRLMRQIHHKLLVAIVGVSDILGIVAFPAIAVSIVTGDLPCGILQHITVAIELIALEGLRSIVFLAGEHEAPGDTIALVEQHHLRVRQFGDSEHGISKLRIAGDIGELRVGREFQDDLVAIDIKAVGSLLNIDISHEVHTVVGIVLSKYRATCIDIHRTTITRIVGVTTFGSEGKTVVVHTPVSLVARGCTPPVATISTRLTTTHMSLLSVVDTPGARDTVDIRGEVYLRVLKRKLLRDTTLTETITVTEAQFHIIGTCLTVSPVHGVQRRVGVAVDFPDGIGLCRHVSHSEGGLVHRLIHIHIDVHIRDGGDAILIRAIEGLWRTSRQRHSDHQ